MWPLVRLVSLRHVFDAPLRSLLTLIGVAVGVATLVGITAINRSVMDAFRSTIDTVAGKADLTVAAETSGFPEELLETVRGVPGVVHASGGLSVVAPVKDSPGESMYVMGVDLLDDGYFRTYEGADTDVGKLADDLEFLNSTDRLLVSERFARERGLKTGDAIELVTPDGAKPFIIHGLLKETGPLKAFGGAVAVMFFGSLQEAFAKGRTLTRIDVAIDPKVGLEAMKDRLQKVVGSSIEVESPDRRGQAVQTMVRSFQLGLNLGSGVALLVGVFLVYNTVSISVVQRRREIGTLRALGATRRRIRALFAFEAGMFGLLGSLLGLPLGILVGKLAIGTVSSSISELYVKVNTKDVHLGPTEILLGLSLGVLGSIFAASRPAWIASAVQPVEALRKDAAIGAGAVAVKSWPTWLGLGLLAIAWPTTQIPPPAENLPVGGYVAIFFILMGVTLLSPLVLRSLNVPFQRPGQLLFGIAGRLAADNFARAPVRTSVPVSAMSIGVAMAVTLSGFIGSFQASADRWIEQAIPADLFVTSSAKLAGVQNQPMKADVGEQLASIPNLDAIDPVRIMPHEVLGLRIYLISLSSEIYRSRGNPLVLEGKLPDLAEQQQGVVVISENFARRRDLKVGSTFPVKSPTGELTYKVGAVIIDYTSDQGSVLLDRQVFVKQFLTDQVDTFHLYLKDRSQLEQTRAAITAKLGHQFDLYVLSNAELRQEAKKLVGGAFSITYAMEVVAVALALLGIVNTLLAAVLDRTREIGLLRAVGADRHHILKLFAGEAFFIGLTGSLFGVVTGGVVGYIVTKIVGVQATGWNFPFSYPFATALQMIAAATLSAIVAGLYPARRAAQLDVVEALAYE
ncbi:MAG: FtsX-like permease family protein [Myxococcota bacterium]